jgi:hypothetical protein
MNLIGKEAVKEKRITICYNHTTKMVADCLTKAMEGSHFVRFASLIMGKVRKA